MRSVSAATLRDILGQVSDPETHELIREAVDNWRRVLSDDASPWQRLTSEADVILHGGPEGTIYLLRKDNQELRRDIPTLREEVVRLITPAGAIDVLVDFARSVLSHPENDEILEEVSGAISKAGASGAMSPGAVFIMVLMWVMALGLPVAETYLPGRDQGLTTNEIATLGLALAVTWRLKDSYKKD